MIRRLFGWASSRPNALVSEDQLARRVSAWFHQPLREKKKNGQTQSVWLHAGVIAAGKSPVEGAADPEVSGDDRFDGATVINLEAFAPGNFQLA